MKKTKLDSWKHVAILHDKYDDCTYSHSIVYSYMLCKYQWFKSLGKNYFESQQEIADSCRSTLPTVKLSIKWLVGKGLVQKSSQKGVKHNNNLYVIDDVFGIYKKKEKFQLTTSYNDNVPPWERDFTTEDKLPF